MGAVTYPNQQVEQFIEAHFIPVQFNIMEQPEAMERFNTPWTPTLVVMDPEGKQHRRSQGYLDPQRFIAEMSLGRLLAPIDRQQFDRAQAIAGEVCAAAAGDPSREPEALYWASVAHYKASGDANNLLAGWNRLLDQFPESEWAKKVSFIRQGEEESRAPKAA